MGIFIKSESWKRHCGKLFLALFLAVLILGLSYVYFMNLAVLKTAERNYNLDKISEMKRTFHDMETAYMQKLDKLNISYAKSLGFIEAEPDSYLYRQNTVAQSDGVDYVSSFR